jgi:hypothetical protein
LPLSVLSIALVSPIARSKVSLMPPIGCKAESQPEFPEFEDGTKQILWSPESAALKVKRPDEEPFCDTTRWSLSNTSYESCQQRKRGFNVGKKCTSTEMKIFNPSCLDQDFVFSSYSSAV